MGDADFMAEAFLKNGLEVAFHGVNVKPWQSYNDGENGFFFGNLSSWKSTNGNGKYKSICNSNVKKTSR